MASIAQMPRTKVLFDLFESTVEANAHWQTWWALANQAKPTYVSKMNWFPDYFLISERAHFNNAFIDLAHVFDKRRDTSSVERYLRMAKDVYSAVERNSFHDRLEAHAAARDGVLEIRNNVIAHKNAGVSEQEVFARAGVKPREIAALIDEVVAIVNAFAEREVWGNRVPTSNRYSVAALGVLESMSRP